MIHKVSHLKDGIDRLYVSRKGERVLANIEDSDYASIWGLEDCIKKSKESLITAASNSTENIKTKRST